jgi:CHASE domain/Diguanylate cyclase, GGDEF domain
VRRSSIKLESPVCQGIRSTWAPSDPLEISPPRDEYFPILYSSVASNRKATFGVDLNSESVRREAIKRAREGNAIATAQTIQLRNPISGTREGFLAVLPVYKQGLPDSTIAERRRNTLGVIVGAFQTGAIFESILNTAKLPHGVDIYVYATSDGAGAAPVYMRGAASRVQPLEAKPDAEVTDPAQAGELASKIGKLLAAPFNIKNHKVRITSSTGIAVYSADVGGPEGMMMQADLALYGAKDEGRNCHRFYSHDLDREVHERVRTAGGSARGVGTGRA